MLFRRRAAKVVVAAHMAFSCSRELPNDGDGVVVAFFAARCVGSSLVSVCTLLLEQLWVDADGVVELGEICGAVCPLSFSPPLFTQRS